MQWAQEDSKTRLGKRHDPITDLLPYVNNPISHDGDDDISDHIIISYFLSYISHLIHITFKDHRYVIPSLYHTIILCAVPSTITL